MRFTLPNAFFCKRLSKAVAQKAILSSTEFCTRTNLFVKLSGILGPPLTGTLEEKWQGDPFGSADSLFTSKLALVKERCELDSYGDALVFLISFWGFCRYPKRFQWISVSRVKIETSTSNSTFLWPCLRWVPSGVDVWIFASHLI